MILALFLLFLGADDPVRRSCKIELTTVDQKAFWWHVHGTDEAGLTRLVSIRPGSQTMAALKDCSLFLRGKLPKKPKTMANINHQRWKFVALGCSHGYLADLSKLKAALAFCDDFKPQARAHLGDFTDQTAFRSGAKGTNDETASIKDDLTAGLSFLREFRPTILINGNHEDRLWKLAGHHNEIIARAAGSVVTEICDLMRKMKSLHVTDYDINAKYPMLGDTTLVHGFMYGEHAVRDHAEHFGRCILAHLHRRGEAPGRRADHPVAYCVGALADIPSLAYAKTRRATAMWNFGLAYGEYTDKVCHVNLKAL